jgi:hypothetical protein
MKGPACVEPLLGDAFTHHFVIAPQLSQAEETR